MKFPRYFDVTLPGECYPALIEVATDREVELWDPLGWGWVVQSRLIVTNEWMIYGIDRILDTLDAGEGWPPPMFWRLRHRIANLFHHGNR